MNELFRKTIFLLQAYKNDPLLSEEQQHIINEIVIRLERTSSQYLSIVAKNDLLLIQNPNRMEDMSVQDLYEFLKKQSKTNPNVGELLPKIPGYRKVAKAEVSSHDMSELSYLPQDYAKQLNELHSETEAIYNNFWWIKVRLNKLPKFTGFKAVKVSSVRNRLIKESDGFIYSFGIATHGPVLKPIKHNAESYNDKGLEINIKEFLSNIVIRLDT